MTGPLRLANGCCRFGPAWLSTLRPHLQQLPALAKEAKSEKVHVPACTGLDRLLLADRIHVKEVQQFLQIAARALCSLFTHWHRHYDSRLTRNSEVLRQIGKQVLCMEEQLLHWHGLFPIKGEDFRGDSIGVRRRRSTVSKPHCGPSGSAQGSTLPLCPDADTACCSSYGSLLQRTARLVAEASDGMSRLTYLRHACLWGWRRRRWWILATGKLSDLNCSRSGTVSCMMI